MKKRVYIESSIPSFYHEVRREPSMAARRRWTRIWWDERRDSYDARSSIVVLKEVGEGDYPTKPKVQEMVRAMPLLQLTSEVERIAGHYLRNKLMPSAAGTDALHLALASYHECRFLLTWNCAHLANANKFEHIRKINQRLGLLVPAIVTPLELLGDEIDETAV